MMNTLRRNNKGEEVKRLQQLLAQQGYSRISQDGIFGAGTEAAVKDFQGKHGLTADGIVGTRTWEALSKDVETGGGDSPSLPCPCSTIKVLIDNGHGKETPGKRSPDGRLKEYAYAREIAECVVKELKQRGVNALRIVTEETDIPLAERVARANKFYEANGRKAILVSVHCNAAGNGAEWMSARGWSVFVGGNASQKSRLLARKMAEAALAKKVKVRQPSRQSLYWTADLYICRKTSCPTVLVENFFQDNREDVAFLLSEEGKKCVTDILVEGIMGYLQTV